MNGNIVLVVVSNGCRSPARPFALNIRATTLVNPNISHGRSVDHPALASASKAIATSISMARGKLA
jgi:hypothetical protein